MPASLHPQHSPRTVPLYATRLFPAASPAPKNSGRFAPGPVAAEITRIPDKVRPHRSAGAHAARLCFLRLADRIYWTRKKVTFKAGENAFHRRQAPCACALRNRISETPAVPTSLPSRGRSFGPSGLHPLIRKQPTLLAGTNLV